MNDGTNTPTLWLAWNTSYTGIRFWTADPVVAAQQAGTGLVLTPFYSASQMQAARACTCHRDDSPPQPCAKQFALFECKAAQAAEGGP